MTTVALFFGVILVLVAGIALWAIGVYNRLVRLRNLKEEGWSGVDVQLKRRHDLVGNLVNSVKGYMAHEREVLEEIARCRSMALNPQGVEASAAAETGLSSALTRLFAVMENYPQLKANENVMHLQQSLTGLEDEIQMARRYYNGAVREFNTLIESFPSNLVAQRAHFTKAEFFELENATEREVPVVSL